MDSGRIITAIREYKLNHSENAVLKPLRQNEWLYQISIPSRDNLFDDVLYDLVVVSPLRLQALPLTSSSEYDSYKRQITAIPTNSRPEDRTAIENAAKRTAIKDYIKSKLSIEAPDFESRFLKLDQAWKSGMLSVLQEAMQAALAGQDYKVEASSKAYIKYEKSNWHIDVVLSDITVTSTKSGKQHPIANTVTAHFVLDENNFKLQSFDTINPLLDDLCIKQRIRITPQLLAQQVKETAFYQAVTELQNDLTLCHDQDPRKEHAQAVLNEILRLKSKHNYSLLDQFTDVLKKTSDLVTYSNRHADAPPDIALFKTIATRMGEHSWGVILASAMMCLAGVALTIVSGAAATISFGTTAALSAMGIVTGVGLAAAGGFFLFSETKKKPIKEKMMALANITEAYVNEKRNSNVNR